MSVSENNFSRLMKKIEGLSMIYLAQLLIYVMATKLRYGFNIRLIKCFPYVLNRGKLTWRSADGFTAGAGLRIEVFEADAILNLGKNIKVNDFVHIGVASQVTIGDNCLIGSRVTIIDHDHGEYNGHSGEDSSPGTRPDNRPIVVRNVVIGKNTWIAEGVVILSGSEIGSGCIVGSNSVVRGCFPDNVIIVGAPARIVKRFDSGCGEWVRTLD